MDFIDTQESLAATQKDFNFKKHFLKLLRRWPFILLFFVVSVAIGYAINRYATPIYEVTARITTKKFSNQSTSPIPGLVDANFFLSGMTEVYEEIPTLMAPKRIEAALDKVDFRVSYFSKGVVKTTAIENSRGVGFDVVIDSVRGGKYPFGVPIFVNHLSLTTFALVIEDEEWKDIVKGKKFRFNKPLRLGGATITIVNTNGRTAEHDKYYFILNRKSDLVARYRQKLDIRWAMRGSSMLDLRIETASPDKDLDFMKAYYQVVEEMGLEEKNETLDNTIRFIDKQMESVTDSLIFYQELIDQLKLENRQLTLGSDYIYKTLNELDEKRAEIQLNERYFDYLIDYFRNNRNEDVFAPSLLGLNIPPLEAWVNQYVQAKLKDKYDRNENNALNPLVNREDSLRRKLEKGIYESINSARIRNRQVLDDLNRKEATLYTSVEGVQTDSRELSRYQRMFALNQTMFDLFLRRKTEAAISKASATSDYKVINAPSVSKSPIKPNEEQNLLIAAALGLILPIGFFLFRDITNNKIMDRDDLLSHTQMPLLGNVAHSHYPTNLVIAEHPRSVVSESFRAVRANLKYMTVNGQAKVGQTFLITSSVGGEGKTFCSLNLAYTLAVSERRTVLIGADLRKPQLTNYINLSPGTKGLSEYLAGIATIEEVINPGIDGSPDFIDSGNVPPNPSELLGSERMKDLMGHLKHVYEYIIIDTPPIGLVSDAMELFKYTDYNILIVRQEVTHKAALDMINELYLEGKLKNFCVLFNDIDISKRTGYYGGYLYGMGYGGYGYGYYQEDDRKRKQRRLKNVQT